MSISDNNMRIFSSAFGSLCLLLVISYSGYGQCSIDYTSFSTPGGAPIVCSGTVDLIATVYGNTGATFNWYNSSGLNIGANSVPQDTHGEGSSAKLSVFVTSSAGFYVSATCNNVEGTKVPIWVNVSTPGIKISFSSNPSSGTEPSNLCQGDIITLRASGGGGTYNWTSTSGSVNIANMDQITATTTDTYTVTGTNICGTTTSTSIPLTFLPPICSNILLTSNMANLCQGTPGATTQMSANCANASVDWAIDGAGNSIGFDGLITWGSSFVGTATVKADAYGCDDSHVTNSTSFYIAPRPVAGLSPAGTATIPFGQDYISLNATPAGNTYSWFKNGSQVTGASSSQLNAIHTGSYFVRVTNSFGCSDDSDPLQVNAENNYNYVIENTLLTDTKSDNTTIAESDVMGLSATQRSQRVRYFDGSGRPMQDVQTQGTPGKMDLVRPVTYDDAGRQPYKYLPYGTSDTNGWYKTNPVGSGPGGASNDYTTSPQAQFYQNTTTVANDLPYVQTYFEDGASGRILKQGAPGMVWQPDTNLDYYSQSDNDKSTKMTYEFNMVQDHILLFTYDPTTGVALATDGTNPAYYPYGGLVCTRTKDEHNKETITYTDEKGKTVCQRKEYSQTTDNPPVRLYAETYYIYDLRGNLVIMLPPEAVNSALSSFTQK